MIQQSKSIKINKASVIAAAIVAAIVIAMLFGKYYEKRSSNRAELELLLEQTNEAKESFRKKYREISFENKLEEQKKVKAFLDSLFNKSGETSTFHSLSEIKEIIGTYPDVYGQITDYPDLYCVVFGQPQQGIERYNEFIAHCRLGIPGSMVMAQFTTNLDPIYYYMEFDGDTYHVVEDRTCDGFDEQSGFTEIFSKYLRFESYLQSDQSVIEYGYLTDENKLSYADVIDYYENVNTNPNILEPEYWQFYMSTSTQDELKERRLKPDRVNKEYTTNYTGYADVHFDFCNDNPLSDYDSDGILDRVYREYKELSNSKSIVNVYLFLGNGNNVSLGKNIWGEKFKTQMADVTGDGYKDICFIQYTDDVLTNEYSFSVYRYSSGNYIALKVPQTRFNSLKLVQRANGNYGFECTQTEDDEPRILYYENNEWKYENE